MSEFVDYLVEVFEAFGPIQAKRMFGGYGIYHQGVMFALVADDELYLKADAQTEALFQQSHARPFEYQKGGKLIKMSYYSAPDEIFDDPDAAAVWAQRAYAAALRSAAREKPARKPAKK